LVAFLGASVYSRAAIVDACGQDCFRVVHHEERFEPRGSARCGV
jgi:hypothetical protein